MKASDFVYITLVFSVVMIFGFMYRYGAPGVSKLTNVFRVITIFDGLMLNLTLSIFLMEIISTKIDSY